MRVCFLIILGVSYGLLSSAGVFTVLAAVGVADYYTAAPRYGTNEDLKELFTEAHKRGIHVLLGLYSTAQWCPCPLRRS